MFCLKRFLDEDVTFRSSNDVDALSCADVSLNVCGAVCSWDYNVCGSR